MKLLWILFIILFDLAWKLAMIFACYVAIVAVGMGIFWLFFESGAGPYLVVISILIIIGMVTSRSKRDAEGNQSV